MSKSNGIKKSQIDEIVEKLRSEELPADNKLDIISERLTKLFIENTSERTVLGIDVYRYSQYGRLAQAIIPHVLHSILKLTVENLIEHEEAFFSKESAPKLEKDYIDTGDGGYLIFEKPLQALLFLIYFQANLLVYNTSNIWPELTYITRALSVRYCLTLHGLYKYESTWYGPAIINNARILASDKLNRLLIDSNVKDWFDLNTNGIETLAVLSLEDFKTSEDLKSLLLAGEGKKSLVFPQKSSPINIIRNVNQSQIGQVSIKDDLLAVYNLHIQCYLNYTKSPEIGKNVITIGNLNTQGIGVI